MCKLCDKYDFRRVLIGDEPEAAYIALAYGHIETPPENERFRFCPLCGRELTEGDFRRKDAE